MHASLEQLTNLRDGEATPPELRDHVRGCEACSRTLNELTGIAAAIREIPDPALPADAWPRILAAAERSGAPARRRRRRMLVAGLGLGLAASAAAAVLLAVALPRAATPMRPAGVATTRPAGGTLDHLMAQSRYLEESVLTLSSRADQTAVSAGTATTVAALEDRIALVDYEISHAAPGSADDRELKQLWRQRVQLLQALAAVRYAQVADNSI